MVQLHAIPANVKAELARRGKTQRDLADLLGLSTQAISRRLTGRLPFDVDELSAVAAYLGMPVASLFNDALAS